MASEYGWSKHDIFYDVYFDELYYLTQKIEKRKLAEYKMQLAIAQNPHVKDPKELWRILNSQTTESYERPHELDNASFEILKSKLSSNPRFVVK